MLRITAFLFILIQCTSIFCNENDKYIEEISKDLAKLMKKGKFVSGELYYSSDTVETSIFLFRGKSHMNNFLFALIKKKDSFDLVLANDLLGYRINEMVFLRHSQDDNAYFIKKIQEGKVDLYERMEIPSDKRFVYYMKFQFREDYYIICPDEDNITEQYLPDKRNPNSSSRVPYYKSKMLPEKFKQFVFSYLGDCEDVRNLVRTDFYTINDLSGIIETYNNCFD